MTPLFWVNNKPERSKIVSTVPTGHLRFNGWLKMGSEHNSQPEMSPETIRIRISQTLLGTIYPPVQLTAIPAWTWWELHESHAGQAWLTPALRSVAVTRVAKSHFGGVLQHPGEDPTQLLSKRSEGLSYIEGFTFCRSPHFSERAFLNASRGGGQGWIIGHAS